MRCRGRGLAPDEPRDVIGGVSVRAEAAKVNSLQGGSRGSDNPLAQYPLVTGRPYLGVTKCIPAAAITTLSYGALQHQEHHCAWNFAFSYQTSLHSSTDFRMSMSPLASVILSRLIVSRRIASTSQ